MPTTPQFRGDALPCEALVMREKSAPTKYRHPSIKHAPLDTNQNSSAGRVARPGVSTLRGEPSLRNGVIADVLRPAAHELLETRKVTGE